MIITNYYPPEIGAASNRISHLANGLNDIGFNVSVVTPLPNYPTGKIFKDYKGKFIHKTKGNGVKIFRLWIFASNSKNKIHRFLAMVSYSFSLICFFTFHKIPKTVIVQSPPLLVAYTCMLFLKRKSRALILNVSDLWPSAGLELGVFKENFSYKMLQKIERYNYRKATMVMGQSQEILNHVKSIVPSREVFLYRNYPDFNPPKIRSKNTESKKIKLVYAGLLGVAQGILKLCKELDYSHVEFHIYGNGAEKEDVIGYINNHKELPIFYYGERDRTALHSELSRYDATIIPLLNRIYGSVPSKIFEYALLGLPIIYFGGGEGETIVEEHGLGWTVEVGNYSLLNKLISELKSEAFNENRKSNIQQKALTVFDFKSQLLRLKDVV